MDVVMRRCFEGRVCSSSMRGFVKSSIHVEACSTSRNRKMMLAMGRLDYLDFDWKDDNKADDLADIKNKYDDYLRQDKASVAAGGQFTWSRRRPLRDAYDLYDEFEDDYDDIPEQPKVQEPRFLNGKQILTNTEIKAPLLRLIGPTKEPIGMKPLQEALNMATQAGMDLLLLNPEQAPPVARIIEWSKYKFENEQADKAKKAKATVVETKEIKLTPKTDSHDAAVKLKSVQKFLEKGNKVKLTMRFEGRQLQFKDTGKDFLLKFIQDLGEIAKVEGPLSFKGATYTVMLAPGKMPQPVPASSASAPSLTSNITPAPPSASLEEVPAAAAAAAAAEAPVPQAPSPMSLPPVLSTPSTAPVQGNARHMNGSQVVPSPPSVPSPLLTGATDIKGPAPPPPPGGPAPGTAPLPKQLAMPTGPAPASTPSLARPAAPSPPRGPGRVPVPAGMAPIPPPVAAPSSNRGSAPVPRAPLPPMRPPTSPSSN